MFVKTSLIAATLMFIAGARAQCPNAGVGIGAIQLCNFSGKNVICGDLTGFITKRKSPLWLLYSTGSWDQAATKNLCGDYVGTPGFGPAHTLCNGNTVVQVVPPNAGLYTNCQGASIVTGGIFSEAAIYFCCYPS
ncbi:hypothetical protein DFH08DRAFT_955515 [Mycena albidolilacea]|uniref:Secreted protein n=1 Tax=Mycena albidolilacea TaxID=1033008 RepID=A0AAD7AB78_9AGAR|nr:hypothetical protein DFH08DRAFT_955515 [Mycena albidolilacea]